MWSMSGRPCNPGNDLKGLWRAFLGNTPMPECPAPADAQRAGDPKNLKSSKITPRDSLGVDDKDQR